MESDRIYVRVCACVCVRVCVYARVCACLQVAVVTHAAAVGGPRSGLVLVEHGAQITVEPRNHVLRP